MTSDEMRAEIEKARAAMGHGTDDARWRPGETAVDALIRERDEALAQLAALREAREHEVVAAVREAVAGALREAAVCLREHAEAMAPGDRRAGVHMAVGMILARADEIERGDR